MAAIDNPFVIPPRKPTWARYKKCIVSPYTLFRTLAYDILSGETFEGKILDVGGGDKSSYRGLLQIKGDYHSINFSRDIAPSIFADIEHPFPVSDAEYDSVISFNTLEHVYHIDACLDEIFRVLKPNGTVFIEVPFLYRGHGSPDDFHRKTHSWWARRMKEVGFESGSITIEPIMWDIRSVGFSLTERVKFFGVPHKIRRGCVLLYGLIDSLLFFRDSSERIPKRYVSDWQDFALGFVVRAKKRA